jgi:hypothetical protein
LLAGGIGGTSMTGNSSAEPSNRIARLRLAQYSTSTLTLFFRSCNFTTSLVASKSV